MASPNRSPPLYPGDMENYRTQNTGQAQTIDVDREAAFDDVRIGPGSQLRTGGNEDYTSQNGNEQAMAMREM